MRKTWDYLTTAGMTAEGAAGMMGNLYAESGVIPNKVENLCLQRLREAGKYYTDATYTAFVDDGTISKDEFLHPLPGKCYGFAIAQWTTPSRKAGLYDLCKSRHASIGDLTCQLEYLVAELQTQFKGLWLYLTQTTDVATASDRVLCEFECPLDTGASVKKVRRGYSQEFYEAYKKGDEQMTIPQKALQWMLDTASDKSHGYSQARRWGPDYDCSSAVITAYQYAGVPVKDKGATYTGNMRAVFLACGFTNVTSKINLANGSGLVKGDVLLNDIHHTAMYAGNGKIVHARGQSYGSSATGDQGTEFAVTSYYNYPWNCVLRYTGGTTAKAAETVKPAATNKGDCQVGLKWFVGGAVDPQVAKIQLILNHHGYKGKNGLPLDVDGELGEQTMYAITTLQKEKGFPGTTNWGTVAAKTWQAIMDL